MSDPVPGDPDVIAVRARHLATVAGELRDQVARLRSIGQDGTLQGKYADRLREVASGLVVDLEQVERRYTRVSSALRGWEPELLEAQQEAERLRVRAQRLDDERRQLQSSAAAGQPSGLPQAPTPNEILQRDLAVSANLQVNRRLEEIEEELRRLSRDLDDVEDRRTSAARTVAGQLRDAIDDDVKDTRWENVKGAIGAVWRAVDSFVDDHIESILKVVEVLSLIATGLAILALFIPGINLLVVALAAGLVLGAKLLLYATDNGSLADVALAGFALVTLGTGKIATVLLKGIRSGALRIAAPMAGARAGSSAAAKTQATRAALGRRLGRNLTPSQRRAARAELDALQRQTVREAARRSARAEADYLQRPLAPASTWQAVRDGGEAMNSRYADDLARIASEFPTAELAAAGRGAAPALWAARGSFAAAAVTDLGDTIAGKSDIVSAKPYSEDWERAKQDWRPAG